MSDIDIVGLEGLGELHHVPGVGHGVAQAGDDPHRAVDVDVVLLVQINLVLPTFHGKILLEQRVAKLVGVDVNVAGLEPLPHLGGQVSHVLVVVRPDVVKSRREKN